MIILGITGTLGAGKGTIVDYLVREKDFAHYSVRSFLLDMIREKDLPENRDSMYMLANALRAEYGPSYVTDQLFEKARKNGKNCIIESIRTTGEIDSLRTRGRFFLIAVDADPWIRYQRITLRKSETDHITFDVFIANERREMSQADPGKQNLSRCIEMADFTINNDGSREELEKQVDEVLELIAVASSHNHVNS